ncbi:MAG: APC family permease [Pigmentiphaga sp.]
MHPSQKASSQLSVLDGVAMLVGVVVGIGIFGFPPLVAMNVDSGFMYMAAWVAGGVIMLIGALCYAELGSTYPSSGGEYHYLQRAYGGRLSLLFAWARGTVIQTGAIAAVAFIYGEYAHAILPLGTHGEAWHAGIAIVVLTILNLIGTRESKRAQLLFTALALIAVVAVIIAGVIGAPEQPVEAAAGGGASSGVLGMAMVFVLLTYGGWNETAYLAGEIRDVRRNLSRVLLLGTLVVMVLYFCVNLAFLHIFGLEGLRNTHAVGADLMNLVAGPAGALLLSLLVCCTALSTINGCVFTGARVYYALGQDVPTLRWLGARDERGASPVNALLVQGAITLGLILFGAFSAGSGVHTMVAYTAPVFWLFMFLIGASLFVMRRRDPARERPFKVPFYPFTPLLFCLTCAGLFYSSVLYAGIGGVIGLVILISGIPFMLRYGRSTTAAAGANS